MSSRDGWQIGVRLGWRGRIREDVWSEVRGQRVGAFVSVELEVGGLMKGCGLLAFLRSVFRWARLWRDRNRRRAGSFVACGGAERSAQPL